MADRAAASPMALLISTAILAAISGYMIGIASSLGFLPIPFMPKAAAPGRRGRTDNYDDEEESSEEDIDEGILDHAPNWANGLEADKRDGLRATAKALKAIKKEAMEEKRIKRESREEKVVKKEEPSWEDNNEECKLVLVVRTDLGMTKGLLIAAPLASDYTDGDKF